MIRQSGGVAVTGPRSWSQWVPAGWQNWIGEEYHSEVQSIGLEVADPLLLSELSGLDGITQIILSGSTIDDQALAHLGGITSLQNLVLTDCSMTASGLGALKGLHRLQGLGLSNTRVDDT